MTMNESQPTGLSVPLDLRTKAREHKSNAEDGLSCSESPGDTAGHKDTKHNVMKNNQNDSELLAKGHASNHKNCSNSVPCKPPCSSTPTKPVQGRGDKHQLTISFDALPSDPCRAPAPSVKYEGGPAEVNAVDSKSTKKPISNLPLRKRPFPTPDVTKELQAKRTLSSHDSSDDMQRVTLHPNASSTQHQRKTLADLASPCHMGNPCNFLNVHLGPFSLHPIEKMEVSQEVVMATRQDDDGDTALHIAVVQGLEMLVCRLIDTLLQAGKGLDIYNNLFQTPLHLAVITHQARLVQVLLSAGADPSMLDRHGQTAAHLCCEHGQSTCLTLILNHPMSQTCLKARNYEGLTPLHLAVQSADKVLVKMLLDSGADINAVDFKSGRSPLIHAVENNSMEMISFLIESGSNVNVQSYSGNTALHSACGRGQVEAVRVLLRNGADSSLKNYHNDTALMVAKNKNVTDVLRGKGSRSQSTKTVDPCDSVSPPRCTPQSRAHSTDGTPVQSPSQSLCPSPLATAAQMASSLRRSNPDSPKAPPTRSPISKSVENQSGSQPIAAKQEGNHQKLQLKHMQSPMTADYGTAPRIHAQLQSCVPADCGTYRSSFMDGSLDPIISSYPVCHNFLQAFYPERSYILLPQSLPHPLHHTQLPCCLPVQSRPSSRSSNQSDTSTMSISSGDKGES